LTMANNLGAARFIPSKKNRGVSVYRKWANQVESKQELKFNRQGRFKRKREKVCGRQHRYSIPPLERPQLWIAIAKFIWHFAIFEPLSIVGRYLIAAAALIRLLLPLLVSKCLIERR
jgi:hypothetical protein